ncbi:MAG: aspartyl aminopeptidase [bacterium]|jgi:aspartyl aminopeptidase
MQKKSHIQFNQDLLQFLQNSPTPFHATNSMKEILVKNGFQELQEKDDWKLKTKGKYFVIRGGSSIIAFQVAKNPNQKFHMVGAHTDSPCLKLKPNPENWFQGYLKLGVETYGGMLLNPWFDRDLSLAGKISWLDNQGNRQSTLIDFKKPIAVVPNLAIHLNRNANENRTVNKQLEMPPLFMKVSSKESKKPSFLKILKKELKRTGVSKKEISEIVSYDLFFYDTQKPKLIGYQEEFISSARLDNLLSCFVGLQAILKGKPNQNNILVCNDHEEVGSDSTVGAGGNFLKSVLLRIAGNEQELSKVVSDSLLVSTDNAHAVHPNYASYHDANHAPLINEGPVIKINANQRYATTSETTTDFIRYCKKAKVPYQKFVTRTDLGCGSTIGPITSTLIGIPTLDVGVPTFAMHSIRELAGNLDAEYLYLALKELFQGK